MIMRMVAVLCAMIANASEPVLMAPNGELVCCEISRGIYGATYEFVEESYCDMSSNRLLGYGHREVVDDAMCMTPPPPVALEGEEAWELVRNESWDAL
jgi:hypothetical protein